MERVRVNPLAAIFAMWKDKPDIDISGEQEEVLAKLAPREALELNKSLKRADNMAGKILSEKAKNDFKNNTKVEGKKKIEKSITEKAKSVKKDEKEIVE